MVRVARAYVLLIVVLFISFNFGGCATTKEGKVYDSLVIGLTVYDTTMQYLGDEYRAGRITEVQKDRAIVLGNRYKLAFKTATKAMAKYTDLVEAGKDGTDAQEVLDVVMDLMLEAKSLFYDYAAQFGGG